MKNLDALQNLKILSIQSNRIRDITGLDKLSALEELYISHNALTTLSGLESCSQLRVLDISNNQVSSLAGIQGLKEIEEVWASYNQIADFNDVEENLKDKEKLNTVYFEGNPLQLRAPALYRNKVRLTLPQVMQIDASKLPPCMPWAYACVLTMWQPLLEFRRSQIIQAEGVGFLTGKCQKGVHANTWHEDIIAWRWSSWWESIGFHGYHRIQNGNYQCCIAQYMLDLYEWHDFISSHVKYLDNIAGNEANRKRNRI